MESTSITSSGQEMKTLFKRTLRMNNGLEIPQVGFGCYQVRNSEPFYWALKHGYRHLDSAAFYKNEQ